MHNVAFTHQRIWGAASDRLRTHPNCWRLGSAGLHGGGVGSPSNCHGEERQMTSGIQGLRRLEVRDEHGVKCGLLIGFTESHQLVIGIAPASGVAPMVIVEAEESGEVFKLLRGALRGELP